MAETLNGTEARSDTSSPTHQNSVAEKETPAEFSGSADCDEGTSAGQSPPNVAVLQKTDKRKSSPEKSSDNGWLPPLHMLEPTPIQPTLTKRRRTVLSIADKADLIRRMRNGDTQRELAFEYGIGTSTVSDVKKHEAEILRYVEANGDFVAMNRRKLEAGAKVDVEEAVFDWLLKEMRNGRELSSSDVMAKARAEHQRLRGNEEFRASTGWLERFKRRYNIRSFKPGEESSWKPIASSRVSSDDTLTSSRSRRKDGGASSTGRKSQRASVKGANKNRPPEFLERVPECSSPPNIKSEIEFHDEFIYADVAPEDTAPDVSNTFHPMVNLEEGQLNFSIPPVEEIPSAGETASMLSKALVWAAAQQETTPQELYILKQMQAKAALKCIMRATQ